MAKKIIKYFMLLVMLLLFLLVVCYFFLAPLSTYLLTKQLKQQGFRVVQLVIRSADFQRLQLDKLELIKNHQYQFSVNETLIHYDFFDLLKGRLDNISIENINLRTLPEKKVNNQIVQADRVVDLSRIISTDWFAYLPFQWLKVSRLSIDSHQLGQSFVLKNIQLSKENGVVRIHSSIMDMLVTLDLKANNTQQLNVRDKVSMRSLLKLKGRIYDQYLLVDSELNMGKNMPTALLNLPYLSVAKARLIGEAVSNGNVFVDGKLFIPLNLNINNFLNDIKVSGIFEMHTAGFEMAGKGRMALNLKGEFDLDTGVVNWRLDKGSESLLISKLNKALHQHRYAEFKARFDYVIPDQLQIKSSLSGVMGGYYDISRQLLGITGFGPVNVNLSGDKNGDKLQIELSACEISPLKRQWFYELDHIMENEHISAACDLSLFTEFVSVNLPELQLSSKMKYQQGKIHKNFKLFIGGDTLNVEGDYYHDLMAQLMKLDFQISEADIASIMMIATEFKVNNEFLDINIDQGVLALTAKLEMKKGKLLEDSWVIAVFDNVVSKQKGYSINGMDAKLLGKVTSDGNMIEFPYLRINSVDAGVTATSVELSGKLKQQLKVYDLLIDDGKAQIFDGMVFTKKLHLNSQSEHQQLIVYYRDIALAELVQLLGRDDLQISGRVSGELPLIINDEGQIRIDKGKLSAGDSGGMIKFQQSAEVIKNYPLELQKVVKILEDFYYKHLEADVSYEDNGILTLALKIKGSNPAFQNNRQVHLNLNVSNNLVELLKSLRLKDNMEKTLEKQLNKSMNINAK